MAEYREWIRACIYEKLVSQEADISLAEQDINGAINQYTEDFPDYGDKAKISLEIVVPIKLPPNTDLGYCSGVLERIKNELILLGGGAQESLTSGSWLSPNEGVVAENCISLRSSIPIAKWRMIISCLQKVISEIIQPLLYQQCVFYRIDEIQYGEPVNLKGDLTESYPSAEEFGEIDVSCMEFISQPNVKSDKLVSGQGDLSFQEIKNSTVEELILYGENLHLVGEHRTAQGIFSKAKNKAKIEADVENYVSALSGLGNVFHHLGQTTDAILCYREAIQIARENEIVYLIVSGYHNISLVLLDIGELGLARKFLEEYEDIILNDEKLNDNQYGNACYYLLRAFISEKEGSLDLYENYLLRAKEEASLIEDNRFLSVCYHNLAQLHFQLDDLEKSEKYLRLSLENKEEGGDKFGLAHDYLAYATLEGAKENYDEMYNYAYRAYEISNEIEAKKLIGISLYLLAAQRFNISQFKQALVHLEDAIEYHEQTHSATDLVESLVLKSKIKIKQNEYFSALDSISRAVETQISSSEEQVNWHLENLLLRLAEIFSEKFSNNEDSWRGLIEIPEMLYKLGLCEKSAKLYSNNGVILYEQGELQDAKSMFEKSHEIFLEMNDTHNAELVMENILELDISLKDT